MQAIVLLAPIISSPQSCAAIAKNKLQRPQTDEPLFK